MRRHMVHLLQWGAWSLLVLAALLPPLAAAAQAAALGSPGWVGSRSAWFGSAIEQPGPDDGVRPAHWDRRRGWNDRPSGFEDRRRGPSPYRVVPGFRRATPYQRDHRQQDHRRDRRHDRGPDLYWERDSYWDLRTRRW